MIVIPEEHLVESAYIEWLGHGYTVADGHEIRPAEYTWHLIFTQQEGIRRILVVGALEEARPLSYVAGGESLWIRFKVGTYLPRLPASATLNRDICLPNGSGNNFWLKNQLWEIPTINNADTFVEQLARAGELTHDPLIEATLRSQLGDALDDELNNELPPTSERTIRHRFQHSTGLRQSHIRQIKRAERAVELLRQGNSILETAHDLGYADQPHLTRSLKRLRGYTPREIIDPTTQPG